MRDDAGAGEPLASGVEAAIVAEALGEHVADVAFAGPLLAADLARRAGVDHADAVAFTPTLTGVAVVSGPATTTDVYAVDATGAAAVVVPHDDGYQLATVHAGAGASGADLTRSVAVIPLGDTGGRW